MSIKLNSTSPEISEQGAVRQQGSDCSLEPCKGRNRALQGPEHPRKQRPTGSSSIVDGELYTDVNETFISNSSPELRDSFRSGSGVYRRCRACRCVGIHCARKALRPQIGTAQYLVRLSPPCTGKLRTSRRHDERYIRVKIRDCTEARPIVRRQSASRLKLELGTTRIIRSAMVSARRFRSLRGA